MREKILEAIAERDMDLLVLEEFHCSKHFQKWFLNNLKQDDQKWEFVNAWHSMMHPIHGESDIEVIFSNGEQKLGILIENKVGADFQPNQSERYHHRGKEYIFNHDLNSYVTVLLAPQKYLNAKETAGFDHIISYEKIITFFENQKFDPERAKYKIHLIKEAIRQSEMGYIPIPNEAVSAFWAEYYNHALLLAPELEMKKPEKKPARSGFVAFAPKLLSKNVRIVHKLPHGNVDLEFAGKANDIHLLAQTISLSPDMILTQAAKSAAVRIKVPIIDTSKPFGDQLDAVRAGISASKRLFLLGLDLKNK